MLRRFAFAASLLALTAGPVQAFQDVTTSFGQAKSNPGNLKMYVHVPQQLRDPAPLVFALHGCTQSATTYHNESGWSELADRYGFYVVYPQQNTENKTSQTGNPYSCFNWAGYYGAKMGKGEGENGSIKQMVDYMQELYNIDSSHIYITGLSAGGGMAAMMLALYPDVFAGGAPMAGLPYHCASNVDDAYACMGVTSSMQPRTGAGCEAGEACLDPRLKRTAEQWGNLARSNNGNHQGAYPRVLIWQGEKDQYVDDDNAIELMEQFTNLHGTDQTADVQNQSFNGSTKHAYREYTKNGKAVVGVVNIPGMKHGITVDPGTGEDQGGKPALAMGYTFDFDVFSSYYTARWWGLLEPTNDRPKVEITKPTDNTHLQGPFEIKVTASDDDGIVRVDFYLDEKLVRTDETAPFSTRFNADNMKGGNHTIRAVATEAHKEGKVGEAILSFSTGNAAPKVTFTSPTDGAKLNGTVTFSVDATDNDGIAFVKFYLSDGQSERELAQDASAPYSTTLDTSGLAAGKYSVRALAVDAGPKAKRKRGSAMISFETGVDAFECEQWTAFNYFHATAGRARNVSDLWWSPDYRVVGSDEALGTNSWAQTTIRSTAKAGEYALGACQK